MIILEHQIIYAREYVPLKTYFTAPHGLPITEEFRFFVCMGKVLCDGYYWSNYSEEFPGGKAPDPSRVPSIFLQDVIKRVGDKATFYVIDVAQAENGDWIVIELNDGQMSGLSDCDPERLYKNLHRVISRG
jgi:hypothetical protein